MHITGGRFKNRQVQIGTQKGIRPTSAKVREALFSIIGQDWTGWSFLDAFGGSGIMGLEAASRGAHPVLISEQNKRASMMIRKTIEQVTDQIDVRNMDALKALDQAWDIVFMDPPYHMSIEPFLNKAFQTAKVYIVAETSSDKSPSVEEEVSLQGKKWVVWKRKVYGASMLTIFYNEALDEEVESDEPVEN